MEETPLVKGEMVSDQTYISDKIMIHELEQKGYGEIEKEKLFLKQFETLYLLYAKRLILKKGKKLRFAKEFGDYGINVNFVEISDCVSIRTYERGDEMESLSCGTGSVATAIALYEIGKTDDKEINIHTTGGKLKISFNHDGKKYTNIWLSGESSMVYSGEFEC